MARKRSQTEDVVAKPASDAYTGLLALSLIAMIASCVVLYLDYAQYGNTKAPSPNVPPVAKPAATGAAAAPNILAAFPSEPLPLPTLAVPQPIVPTGGEMPAIMPMPGAPATGPELTPPE
jgi:hypothetical protein